jgi:uncharacterized membrane protein (DUF485 family)
MKAAYEKIAANPHFAELVTRRNRFALTLSAIVLSVFGVFVYIATMRKDIFASAISGDSSWCVGLIAGFIIQAFAFVMTGIYAHRANHEFDDLFETIVKESAE